jgi:hypothetical protein
MREKYCWLFAGGWFVLREKYCWLVADKPNEQAVCCHDNTPLIFSLINEQYYHFLQYIFLQDDMPLMITLITLFIPI